MREKQLKRALSVIVSLFLTLSATQAKTVQNLAQVAEEIHATDGQALFAREVNGTPLPDGFGAVSVKDYPLTTQLFEEIRLLVDVAPTTGNLEYVGLMGLKPWGVSSNVYIFTTCRSEERIDRKKIDNPTKYASCDYTIDPKSEISVGLMEKQPDGKFKFITDPYVETFNPKNTDNNGRPKTVDNSAFALDNHAENRVIGDLDRLDMANYQLNKETKAFGIRYSTTVGYAGGGAINQNMTLFAVIDKELRPILQVPLYQYENIAGDWNKDGTRQHDVNETENIVKISSHSTNGFADIILQDKKTKKIISVYRWNKQLKAYQ